MKKLLIASLILSTSSAIAAENKSFTDSLSFATHSAPYIGLEAGMSSNYAKKAITDGHNILDSFHKNAFVGGIKAGYNIADHVRAELAYHMRGNAKANSVTVSSFKIDQKIRANTLMANLYYDIPTGTAFSPFITAGVGTAFNKLSLTGSNISDLSKKETKNGKNTQFAWSAGLGANYQITENISTNLTGRYLNAGKAKVEVAHRKLNIADVLVGVNYRF